jgi:hypothetical protein
MSQFLQDSGGGVWLLGVTTQGNLTTTLATGFVTPLVLNSAGGQSFQIGVTTIGLLTSTAVPFSLNPKSIVLTDSSNDTWFLSVNVIGQLQTTQLAAWQPNGFGADIDNSIVGGAGGYMAYPQPPQPDGFNPPLGGGYDKGNSWNGQFQAVQAQVYNYAVDVFFKISNPGRSA